MASPPVPAYFVVAAATGAGTCQISRRPNVWMREDHDAGSALRGQFPLNALSFHCWESDRWKCAIAMKASHRAWRDGYRLSEWYQLSGTSHRRWRETRRRCQRPSQRAVRIFSIRDTTNSSAEKNNMTASIASVFRVTGGLVGGAVQRRARCWRRSPERIIRLRRAGAGRLQSAVARRCGRVMTEERWRRKRFTRPAGAPPPGMHSVETADHEIYVDHTHVRFALWGRGRRLSSPSGSFSSRFTRPDHQRGRAGQGDAMIHGL